MKMKKMFVLLITMLLSSCQISSNSETQSEQISDSISTIESISNSDVLSDESSLIEDIPSESEESSMPTSETIEESASEEIEDIYYVDGLPSNLFVTEVNDYMKFLYIEPEDCYYAECNLPKPAPEYIEEIVFPNVYDDGIHGLKRVKHASGVFWAYESTIGKIIISEGIETIRSYGYSHRDESWKYNNGNILYFLCSNLYLPSSIKEIAHAAIENGNLFYDPMLKGDCEFNIHYSGTVEYFDENCTVVMPALYSEFYDIFENELEIICLDGHINLDLFIYYYDESDLFDEKSVKMYLNNLLDNSILYN